MEGFPERTVTASGTSAIPDVPRRYPGRRVCMTITKNIVEGKNVKQ
ncbi:MAG: DUF2080 family transposase-associated protein [Thermoplasmata archaeon]|uniref:DUF2080 family transposase-associated protein n=1 Tax=Candidatus Sysuiplasma superficiale TaxID=2823368 RepID=A0A8J7YT28_9ARCH|nr:DUF2080 family transposase-associated protein [Candidatus Sysuiplasma superficiale]MBX8644180.1 DUF2080 family transposase-associated protein [Candidatus Sysuiplasma superficiale]